MKVSYGSSKPHVTPRRRKRKSTTFVCRIFVERVSVRNTPSMRGGPLIREPPDLGHSRDVCVTDMFTLDSEREPDISILPQAERSIPSVSTAASRSSSHMKPKQRGRPSFRSSKNRRIKITGGDFMPLRGAEKQPDISCKGKASTVILDGVLEVAGCRCDLFSLKPCDRSGILHEGEDGVISLPYDDLNFR